MDSKEKADFINHLRYHIKNDNEGYKYFIHKWNQLDEEDINSLKQPLLVMCYQEMLKDEFVSPSYFEFQNVIKFFDDEFIPQAKKINVSNAATSNEIVKIFMRLKQLGYITNTNEEIANLISQIFDIKNSTALSYLKKPSELESVRNLLN